MSAVALAADAASAPDWVARWLSIAALVVSIASVIVTVLLWRRDGWKLAVDLHRSSWWFSDSGDNSPYEAQITNIGRMPCSIRRVTVQVRSRFPVDLWQYTVQPIFSLNGKKLPRKIGPSETISFPITKLDPLLLFPWGRKYRLQVFAGKSVFVSPWMRPWNAPRDPGRAGGGDDGEGRPEPQRRADGEDPGGA